MAKKKKEVRLKKYLIEVRTEVSYVTTVEASAYNIFGAEKMAARMVREDALSSMPDASELQSIDVFIDGGERIDEDC